MISKILVTTDLSHRGDVALRRGFALARSHGAQLIVMSVIDDALPMSIAETLLADANASLGRFGETHGDGVTWELRIEAGDPTGDILEAVASEKPDLLVMGTHRERSFLDLLRETTAQRITRLAHVPVLVAADRDERPYETAVLGADFSPNSTVGAHLATEIAPDVRLVPVHAIQVPYRGMLMQTGDADELLRSFSAEPRAEDAAWRKAHVLPDTLAPTEIIEGSAALVLTDVARREDAHLIVVGAHGRVGAQRALLGSVASDLMRTPPCDVLIVRRPSG